MAAVKIRDFRIPVRVREDRMGGLYLDIKAGILNEASHLTYLNEGNEANGLLEALSRGQAYRFKNSRDMTLRLDDEIVCAIFGIDY